MDEADQPKGAFLMLRSRRGRTWRAVGAAVLVLGICAGPLAGASSASTLSSFSGKGNGYALGVTVDLSSLPASVLTPLGAAYTQLRNALPANLQAALPVKFTGVIDEKLIETLAQAGASQAANSAIGSGTVDLGKLLGGTSGASATTTGASHVVTKSLQLPTKTMPLVGISAGVLDASIASGPTVSSAGVLSKVNASLAALLANLPSNIQAALAGVFSQVENAVNTQISNANSTLGSQLGSVATTLNNSTDPVIGGLLTKAGLGNDTTSQLTTALTGAVKLPTLASGVLSGDVASITDLHNISNTAKLTTNKVTANASTNLANINVLGLLNVDAIDVASHSEAAGVAGSAKNTSACKIADVKLGDANGVSLDGSNLYVNGTAIPTPVGNLATIQSAITTVTQQLGLSVSLCDTAEKDASADGTAAAQRVSALRVEFAPTAPAAVGALGIAKGDKLFDIVIDPTVETSVAARVAVAAASNPNLPKTGAGALLSVLVGLGLAGTAIFLRRRFA